VQSNCTAARCRCERQQEVFIRRGRDPPRTLGRSHVPMRRIDTANQSVGRPGAGRPAACLHVCRTNTLNVKVVGYVWPEISSAWNPPSSHRCDEGVPAPPARAGPSLWCTQCVPAWALCLSIHSHSAARATQQELALPVSNSTAECGGETAVLPLESPPLDGAGASSASHWASNCVHAPWKGLIWHTCAQYNSRTTFDAQRQFHKHPDCVGISHAMLTQPLTPIIAINSRPSRCCW
jgi:hypothetical protein